MARSSDGVRQVRAAAPEDDDTRTLAPSCAEDSRRGSGSEPVFERGACLSRYVVLGAVGRGAMAHVYAAYDPELDRKVALKILRAERLLSEDREQAQERLRREAQAVAKLNHPNVVSIFDVGRVGGQLFVAMELIEGLTLREWWTAEPRTWREILQVLMQAGRGLAAAHRRGLVHRDFKPSNVMVGRDGRVQVVDFGLVRTIPRPADVTAEGLADAPRGDDEARALPEHPSPAGSLTSTRGALGTPAYMAPEQRAGATVDARADQFSFCQVLYEALYGELPFAAVDRAVRQHQLEPGEMRDPPGGAAVPDWLRRVLRRGLSAAPQARFASMDELLAALGRDRERRRRQLATAAVAVVSAVLLTGLGFLQTRRHQPCRTAEQRLAGTWDAPRKASIRRAFLATGLPFAADAWRRVEEAFDRYAAAWVDMHTEACEATHLSGEQSAELLDRRMACLDDRLYELRALAEVLSETDPRVVEQSIPAAEGLASLAGCADRRALAAMLPPPPDPGTAARVVQVRAALAEAKAQEATGRYTAAMATAEAALAEARELPYRPLLGEAYFSLAMTQGRNRRAMEMEDNLLEAVAIAQATHHDELLAEASILAIINAYLRGAPDNALFWGRLARAAVERLGERGDLEARRLFYLGVAHNMAGSYDEAITHFRASLETGAEVTPLKRANALMNTGLVYDRLGRADQAEALIDRASGIYEEIYGRDHVLLAKPLSSLAHLRLQRRRFEAAMALFERALSLYDRNFGADHPESSFILGHIGWIRVEQDRAGEGVEYLERALRLQEAHPGNPVDLARTRFRLARALELTRGDRGRIHGLALGARDALAALGDRAPQDLEEIEAWIRQRWGAG